MADGGGWRTEGGGWRTDDRRRMAGRVCKESVSRWQCHLAQNGSDGF
ncbi:MAG: hypothetical protein ACYS8Y_08040 [Planctomycetota bacterium]